MLENLENAEKKGKTASHSPLPRLCEKRLCPAAKKSRYTLKIWIFQKFTSCFVLFHHSKWFCCQRSLVTDAWKASKTVKKVNFDGFFGGVLPVSLQTVNFGVMSWQNQKEWYLQIKTVFILGWGKQTIKVWRHSEILGVEIYWPKVDDSAILSFFPHGTGPVPRFWPLRGIITFSILSRFVNFEWEKSSHQRPGYFKKKIIEFGWKLTKL